MTYRVLTYVLAEGKNTIVDLGNLQRFVLKVKREGMCLYKKQILSLGFETSTDPMIVYHRPILGRLKFNTPGNPGGEKVYVLIKE